MGEPYAWVDIDSKIWNHRTSLRDMPLYTKTEWQGLTTDELKEIKDRFRLTGLNIAVAFRTAEAKLKEKNA